MGLLRLCSLKAKLDRTMEATLRKCLSYFILVGSPPPSWESYSHRKIRNLGRSEKVVKALNRNSMVEEQEGNHYIYVEEGKPQSRLTGLRFSDVCVGLRCSVVAQRVEPDGG